MRWLLFLFAGVLLGGVVHFAAILTLPRFATRDAYARLAPIAPVNAFVAVPASGENAPALPFTDPAFVAAVCRYDLAGGPLKLSAPVGTSYTSVSFYNRRGIAYYAINDRAAGRRVIELELMTSDQRAALPDDEEVTAADRLIVESPTDIGLIVLRVLVAEPTQADAARRTAAAARCMAAGAP